MVHSRFVLRLLRLFAIGSLVATQVQNLAAAVWADGLDDDTNLLRSLAKAGSWGSHPGNCLRDIVVAVRAAGLMDAGAKMYEFAAPGPNGTSTIVKCFLPHEAYAKIVDIAGLDECCLPAGSESPLATLLQRWQHSADVTVEHDLTQTAGLGMHVDGVQYTSSMRAGGSKSIYVGSFNVITGQTPGTRAKRHLFFALSKDKLCCCGCSGYHTFQQIFSVFAWSMHHSMLGRSPSARHDGQAWTAADRRDRLPSGVAIPSAALIQVRGDWDWFTTGFRFRSSGGDPFCWMCDAQKTGPLSYTDFRPNAPHRETVMNHTRFMESCAASGQAPSTIFHCPGMVLELIAVDIMHTVDLGVLADALGSLFWLHITNKSWYRNRARGLANLNRELDAYFAANRDRRFTPTSRLTLSQVRAAVPGYPFLKVKAAQARGLCEFGLVLARRHEHGDGVRGAFAFRDSHRLAGRAAEHNALVRSMFEAIVGFQESITTDPFDSVRCKEFIYGFLQSFSQLSVMWRAGVPVRECKVLPWHLRPKHHLLQHTAEDQLGTGSFSFPRFPGKPPGVLAVLQPWPATH